MAGLRLLPELEVTTGRAEVAWVSARLSAAELPPSRHQVEGDLLFESPICRSVDAEIGCK